MLYCLNVGCFPHTAIAKFNSKKQDFIWIFACHRPGAALNDPHLSMHEEHPTLKPAWLKNTYIMRSIYRIRRIYPLRRHLI